MTESPDYYKKPFDGSNIVTPSNQVLFNTETPVNRERGLKIVNALREKHFPKAKSVFDETREKLARMQESARMVREVAGVL